MDTGSISNDVSIRIFAKRLRIHEVTTILVEGDYTFWSKNRKSERVMSHDYDMFLAHQKNTKLYYVPG